MRLVKVPALRGPKFQARGESAVKPYYPSSDGAELGLWDTKRCLLGSGGLGGGQGGLPAAGEGALSRELEEQSPAEGRDRWGG